MTTSSKSILGLALIVSMGAAGCASSGGGEGNGPVEGNAYLTIVGERNVFMENGWQQALTVRYHDSNNQALAGQIEFAVLGDAAGSTLSTTTKSTNASGEAEIFLVAATTGEASFKVRAEAAYSDAAEWTVSVYSNTPQLPMDPVGRYTVDSKFDIVSGLPGAVGVVVNTFIDMTDGAYDPASWLIDTLLDKANLSGTIESLVNAARPALDGVLNDLIKSQSPTVVANLLELGDKFGQVARKFGTVSTLDIQQMGSIEGNEYVANHTMTHVKFLIDGQTYSYTMAELGMDNIVVANIPFVMASETSAQIGDHELPLSYGAMLALALEEVIIPLINPQASTLAELLAVFVDCTAVGTSMSNYIGVGTPGLYSGACDMAITAGANLIMDQIRGIDGTAAALAINGDARPQDTNGDRKVDVLFGGEWAGAMMYGSSPAILGASTFRGDRQVLP